MVAKVIQGFFSSQRPMPPPPVAQSKLLPGPPPPTFASRAPVAQGLRRGPPAPAFPSAPKVVPPRGAGEAFAVDPGWLGLATSSGRPLPDAVRGKMEAALGADFAAVRVHVGRQAERIGAVAFTVGTDIYFAPGRFQPETIQGQQLLGHELAHVVQQRAGRVRNPLGNSLAVVQDRALEAEADRLGFRAATYSIPAQANGVGAAQARSARGWTPNITSHGPAMRKVTQHSPTANNSKEIKVSNTFFSKTNRSIQRKVGFEFELGLISTRKDVTGLWDSLFSSNKNWGSHGRGEVIVKCAGYDVTADINASKGSQIEFILHEVDENSPEGEAAIVRVAKAIVEDIKKICKHTGTWLPGNTIWANCSAAHQVKALGTLGMQGGQLQMTGGIELRRLGHIVSGTAGDRLLDLHQSDSEGDRYITGIISQYTSEKNSQVWANGLAAVNEYYSGLATEQKNVIVSVITIIAQVPIFFHGGEDRLAGTFTAKTDFGKIMSLLAQYMGDDFKVVSRNFVRCVMSTINRTLPRESALAKEDGVFSDDHVSGGVSLGGTLSIGDWLRQMLPPHGIDAFTPHHFPGTSAQRAELRSFGRFKDKVDPGNRPIVEWRDLGVVPVEIMPEVVSGLVEYLRLANYRRRAKPRGALGLVSSILD